MLADWAEGGAAAIKMMRIERPAEYVRVMCSILPKELIFENSAVTELDDDELDHMISMLRERALAARQEQSARKGPGTKAAEWTTLTNSKIEAASGSRPSASGASLRRSRPVRLSACRSSSWPGPNLRLAPRSRRPRPTSWQNCAPQAISAR